MGQLHDESQVPPRIPSRFEIVNALAWILARADDLLANGRDPQQAFEQALQEHEAMLVRNEKRTSARVYPLRIIDAHRSSPRRARSWSLRTPAPSAARAPPCAPRDLSPACPRLHPHQRKTPQKRR
jgi:hypothetical protein